jgi:hypothetical protein
MRDFQRPKSFFGKRTARAALAVVATVSATGAVGCLNRPIDTIEPRLTVTIVEKLQQSAVDKIDLVLGIDNSRSMADKQQILALAIPDLVKGLVNPRCLDDKGVRRKCSRATRRTCVLLGQTANSNLFSTFTSA